VDDIPSLPDDHEVWDIVGGYLGTMCSNIFLTTSVEKIVLGGGVFNREVLISKTRAAFTNRVNKYLIHKRIDSDEAMALFLVRPEHGDDLGLIAAGSIATKLV
jgi:fructokinase